MVVLAITTNSSLNSVVAIGLVLAGVEILIISRLAGGFSAAIIPLLAVSSTLMVGSVVWKNVEDDAAAGIQFRVSEDDLTRAATIGIIFCAAYAVGACIAGPRKMAKLSTAELARAIRAPDSALIATGYAGIALAILAWQGALIRGAYLQANGPFWAAALATSAIPVAVLALSMVAAKPGPWRLIAIVGIAIICLITFARASRNLALVPILFVLGRAVSSGQEFRLKSATLPMLVTIAFLQLPVVGRSNPDGVGLVPLLQQLLTRPGEVFEGFTPSALLGNVLLSAPLTSEVSIRPIDSGVFWMSLNPLPGDLVGWNEVRPTLRLNRYTPYNGLGELASFGWVTLTFASIAIGFLLALATRLALAMRGHYQALASLLVLATVAYFSLSILQYNLRSGIRLVWYLAAGLAAIWLLAALLERRRHTIEATGGTERLEVRSPAPRGF